MKSRLPRRGAKPAAGKDDGLLLRQQDGNVLILTLNRPDKNNALSRPLADALIKALVQADRDASIDAIVLTGAGKSFCAGADTAELGETRSKAAIERHARATAKLMRAPRLCRKPVIAAVHGYALGAGCGLAAACDILVADRDARLGYPELRHGIVPALVMPGLIRRVGEARAFMLAGNAEWIGATMARSIGLADMVSTAGHALAMARDQARRLAGKDAAAIAALKRLIGECSGRSERQAIELAYRLNVKMKLLKARSRRD